MEIPGTPATVFEIWTALAVRSGPIAVLNGLRYAMLVLYQISTALC